MFICDNCGPQFSWCLTSYGPCEDCGKTGLTYDVPHFAWVQDDREREEKRSANRLALCTYPCPVCGKVDMVEPCSCGKMDELKALVRHDTDVKVFMAAEATNA